jgi:hypothetical protein
MKYIFAVMIVFVLLTSTASGYEFQLTGTYTGGKCNNWQPLELALVTVDPVLITEAMDEISIDDDLNQEFMVDNDSGLGGWKLISFVFDADTMPHALRKKLILYWFRYRVNADQEWSEAASIVIDLKPGTPKAVKPGNPLDGS